MGPQELLYIDTSDVTEHFCCPAVLAKMTTVLQSCAYPSFQIRFLDCLCEEPACAA